MVAKEIITTTRMVAATTRMVAPDLPTPQDMEAIRPTTRVQAVGRETRSLPVTSTMLALRLPAITVVKV